MLSVSQYGGCYDFNPDLWSHGSLRSPTFTANKLSNVGLQPRYAVNWKIQRGNFMVTSNFWDTEFPNGEYNQSADKVQYINRILSKVAAQDVPVGKRGQVTDYIHFALLHETIEPAIKDKLEHLLERLQELRAM